jgi:hypothetical protein
MGRPKKRRRGDDAEQPVAEIAMETPASNYVGQSIMLNESSTSSTLSNFTGFGLNSPPELQDLSGQGSGYEMLPNDFPYTETYNGAIQLPSPE